MQTQEKYEVAVSSLMILICTVFLWESWDLPAGTFEPLGSGPVPQATAGIIILCCLLTINSARIKAKANASEEEALPLSVMFGVLMALATLLFVIGLHFRLLAFAWMAAIFLTITIWGLENFAKRKFLPAVVTGLVIGFAVEYLFTQVFVVDLPT